MSVEDLMKVTELLVDLETHERAILENYERDGSAADLNYRQSEYSIDYDKKELFIRCVGDNYSKDTREIYVKVDIGDWSVILHERHGNTPCPNFCEVFKRWLVKLI